jgi:small subunit ribosomal protein S9
MEVLNAVGRRKAAVARIFVTPGKGKIIVNNKDYKEYFPVLEYQNSVIQPLVLVGAENKYDIQANLDGGGIKGQAEALRLAISRVIVKDEPEQRIALKSNGLLRRDPRCVERKKPGQPKARKRFQFSKR